MQQPRGWGVLLISAAIIIIAFNMEFCKGNNNIINNNNNNNTGSFMFSSSSISPIPSGWKVNCLASSTDENEPILVSRAGTFAWIFQPVRTAPQNQAVCVLSIVCYNCTGRYTVWTAASSKPPSLSVVLQADKNGDLVLLTGSSSSSSSSSSSLTPPLWSTGAGNIASIELLETGNLIMLDAANAIVWQSFDHPSNVLLPGQTLKAGMSLVSGDYSLVLEAGGLAFYVDAFGSKLPYLVVNFTWGLTNLESVLTIPPSDNTNTNNTACPAKSELLYTSDGTSLVFQQEACATKTKMGPAKLVASHGVGAGGEVVSGFRYLKLGAQGDLNAYLDADINFVWFDNEDVSKGDGICDIPNHCGTFGVCDPGGECRCPKPDMDGAQATSSLPQPESPSSLEFVYAHDYSAEATDTAPSLGCTQIQPVNCSSVDFDLLRLVDLEYFPHRFLPLNSTTTLMSCLQECLGNCSCTVAFYNNLTRRCFHYPGILSMQRTRYGENYMVFIKVGLKAQKSRTVVEPVLIGLGIASGFTLVAAVLFCSCFYYRRQRKRALLKSVDDDFLGSLSGLPPRYSVKQLQVITNGFTVKLGTGGFGSVYEGCLEDGTKIAVKKLESANQGEKEFRAEVAALGGISHVNLVQLKGFCAEAHHRMLVYEYMTNGSLDRWLYSKASQNTNNSTKSVKKKPFLEWETRFKIAVDAARGLTFLHDQSRNRIFHLDVKPQNILLDEHFNAKVADFGLSKQVDRSQTAAVTSMRGTPGYLAPEWLLNLSVTDKSDVYSFGMVLLEILSGRRNVDYDYSSSGKCYFPAWLLCMAAEGRWTEVIEDILYMGDEDDTEAEEDKLDRIAASVLTNQAGEERAGTGGNISSCSTSYTGSGSVARTRIEQAIKAVKVALWCVQEEPNLRPPMASVLLMLEGHMRVEEPPMTMQFSLASHARISASLAEQHHLMSDSSILPFSSSSSSIALMLKRHSSHDTTMPSTLVQEKEEEEEEETEPTEFCIHSTNQLLPN